MSLWHTLLIAALALVLAFTGLCALLASLYHVRLEAAWLGMWTGGATVPHEKLLRVEHGFPGFMRPLTWSHVPDDDDDGEAGRTATPAAPATSAPSAAAPAAMTSPPEPATASPRTQGDELDEKKVGGEGNPAAAEAGPGATSPSSAPSPSPPEPERRRTTARRRRSVNQVRRALFRFVTDGPAWRLQSGYFLRTARRALRRAGVRAELSVGHPDPAKLGRFAGYWYAAAPFLPARRATMAFRFQDRHPSFGVRVTAAFPVSALLVFGVQAILTFPYLQLSRRALYGWRHRRLEGWRAFAYRKIQSL